MLNTKSDILNLKMQKMSIKTITVTSSYTFFAFKNLQKRLHVRKNSDRHNTLNRFYDKIFFLEHLKNVTPNFEPATMLYEFELIFSNFPTGVELQLFNVCYYTPSGTPW